MLQSWLADSTLDGQRVYAHANGQAGRTGINVSSGLRADGENWYARMADRSVSSGGKTIQQFYWYAMLCREVTGPNVCSSDQRYIAPGKL